MSTIQYKKEISTINNNTVATISIDVATTTTNNINKNFIQNSNLSVSLSILNSSILSLITNSTNYNKSFTDGNVAARLNIYSNYNSRKGLEIALTLVAMLSALLAYILWKSRYSIFYRKHARESRRRRKGSYNMTYWLDYIDRNNFNKRTRLFTVEIEPEVNLPKENSTRSEVTRRWIDEHQQVWRDLNCYQKQIYLANPRNYFVVSPLKVIKGYKSNLLNFDTDKNKALHRTKSDPSLNRNTDTHDNNNKTKPKIEPITTTKNHQLHQQNAKPLDKNRLFNRICRRISKPSRFIDDSSLERVNTMRKTLLFQKFNTQAQIFTDYYDQDDSLFDINENKTKNNIKRTIITNKKQETKNNQTRYSKKEKKLTKNENKSLLSPQNSIKSLKTIKNIENQSRNVTFGLDTAHNQIIRTSSKIFRRLSRRESSNTSIKNRDKCIMPYNQDPSVIQLELTNLNEQELKEDTRVTNRIKKRPNHSWPRCKYENQAYKNFQIKLMSSIIKNTDFY
jgi:hypothetical protein